jgi:hypothetical protein
MSLKTKGFSRETEAFCLFGGGEMHSELLIGLKCRENFTPSPLHLFTLCLAKSFSRQVSRKCEVKIYFT